MPHAYKLYTPEEAHRLEKQSEEGNFSIMNELGFLNLKIFPGEQILDAGCGSGLLGRSLVDLFPEIGFKVKGIDMTEELLDFATQATLKHEKYQRVLSFEHGDLCNLKIESEYDKIFCRFVFQHIPTQAKRIEAALSLYLALRPGGLLSVIESYGYFSHLDCKNPWLMEKIEYIEKKIPIDLNIGIKLRGLFLDVGVPIENISVETLPIKVGTRFEREKEALLWKQRFSQLTFLLNELLGESEGKRFSEEYVEAILDDRTYCHGEKFFVQIRK